MIYNSKEKLEKYYKLFLNNCEHYIFLSTYRVYAGEYPITENSPRLLDVEKPDNFVSELEYSIYKAEGEDLLLASDYNNFTIVRPATTFSEMRYQLVTLEAKHTVGRASKGKKVVVPIQAKDKPATLCWGGDVAKMIARLMFKEETMREAYNVCSSESRTWGEIAEYYKDLCGLEAVWVDKEDYLKIKDPAVKTSTRWQLEYARLFHRITDNSKMLAVTGLKQSDFMPLYDALKMMIAAVPEGYEWPDTPTDDRMDKYLEEHGL
jgi:nucleoside-diphosphate-sugar epimerase